MSLGETYFEREYLAGLEAYLRQAGEGALSEAYELGRRALIDGLGVLDMAALHRTAIERLVLPAAAQDRERFAQAAGEYFNELLSPFEMSLRGYRTANAALQRLNQTLQSQKEEVETVNQELKAFSHSVSHDLRGPIASIDGFSRLLLEFHASQLDAEGMRFVRNIQQSTEKMTQLIDALLGLARATNAEMLRTEVDLTAMAREIGDRLHTLAPDRQVRIDIQEGLRANGDARLLCAVLENLLGNAWKFTSKRQEAMIEVGSQQHERRTVYFVRDNGAGFDMAYAKKLFGTFSRLHPASEFDGTGIGLATVQRIVHRHGGDIWAESKVNGGATFYFALEGGRRS